MNAPPDIFEKEKAMVCYPVNPGPSEASLAGAGNQWQIIDDPEDAAYYQTCYRRVANRLYNNVPYVSNVGSATATPPVEEWKLGDYCLKCDQLLPQQQRAKLTDEVTYWDDLVTDECKKCD